MRLTLRKRLYLVMIVILLITMISVVLIVNVTISSSIENIFEENLVREVEALREQLLTIPVEHLKEYNMLTNTHLERFLMNDEEISFSFFNGEDAFLHSIEGISVILNDELIYSYYRNNEYQSYLMSMNDESGNSDSWYDGSINNGLFYASTSSRETELGTLTLSIISVSPIETVLNSFKESYDIEATLFIDNIRYATTIVQNNISLKGTVLKEEIANQVLIDGKEYFGVTNVLKEEYLTFYTPLSNYNKEIFGVFFIGIPKDFVSILTKQFSAITNLFIILLGLALFLMIHVFLKGELINPLKELRNLIKKIGNQEPLPTLNPLNNKSEEFYMLYQSLYDMNKQVEDNKATLENIAYHDSFTALKNRNALMADYSGTSPKKLLRVLYLLNIDGVKIINRMAGHQIGDNLIIETSNRLKNLTDKNGYDIYYVSGAEFVLCSSNIHTLEAIESFNKLILECISKDYEIDNNTITATCSIGVSYCEHCQKHKKCNQICSKNKNFDQLFKNAEYALKFAKDNGRNNTTYFNVDLLENQIQTKEIESALQNAITDNQLSLNYQPKYAISDDKYNSFEALIRWYHPELGFISPDIFIPIAEQNGYIDKIGKFVFSEAFETIKKINGLSNQVHRIAINVSVLQLMRDDFLQNVLSLMTSKNVDPRWLEFEITESVLMASFDNIVDTIKALRHIGVKIALDDFGTGFSSLTYLEKLPIDILKIDKSFVDRLSLENESCLVEDIIRIGKKMDLSIVAEGVETAEQSDMLKEFKCDEIQGYYYSKPLKYDYLIKFLQL